MSHSFDKISYPQGGILRVKSRGSNSPSDKQVSYQSLRFSENKSKSPL